MEPDMEACPREMEPEVDKGDGMKPSGGRVVWNGTLWCKSGME